MWGSLLVTLQSGHRATCQPCVGADIACCRYTRVACGGGSSEGRDSGIAPLHKGRSRSPANGTWYIESDGSGGSESS